MGRSKRPPLSCSRRQLTHALLTRSPLYSPAEAGFRARLACLRHAASVRSEPVSYPSKKVCLLYDARTRKHMRTHQPGFAPHFTDSPYSRTQRTDGRRRRVRLLSVKEQLFPFYAIIPASRAMSNEMPDLDGKTRPRRAPSRISEVPERFAPDHPRPDATGGTTPPGQSAIIAPPAALSTPERNFSEIIPPPSPGPGKSHRKSEHFPRPCNQRDAAGGRMAATKSGGSPLESAPYLL